MRTRSDLEGAFALLERAADEYTTSDVSQRPSPGHSPRSWLIAAAVAAVLAIGGGATWVFMDRHSATPPGGTTSPNPTLLRKLHFVPTLAKGQQLVGGGAWADGAQFAWFSTPHGGRALLDVDPPVGTDRTVADSAQHVAIGTATGYYRNGKPPVSNPDVHSPLGYGVALIADQTRTLAWQIAPRQWATLSTWSGVDVGKAVLLQLARGLDFTGWTALRSPITLQHEPRGLMVMEWVANYPAMGSWGITFELQNAAGQQLELSADAGHEVVPSGAQRTTVAGSPAYWAPGTRTLFVFVRPGLELSLSPYLQTARLTRAEATALLAKVVSVRDPASFTTWFDAGAAMPR